MCKSSLVHGGYVGSCAGCPFNDGYTEEASQAQNYGCLPTAHDIVQMKLMTGNNWGCHENEKQLCRGLAAANKEHNLGLDLRQGELIAYSRWYREGDAAAANLDQSEKTSS